MPQSRRHLASMKPKEIAARKEALVKASLWDMVHAELTATRFDLSDLLGHARDVHRLNVLRFRIWKRARAVKDPGSRDPTYSFAELGRLFNRNHSTIMAGVYAAR